MNQGTASPPAKKDLRFRPVRANNIPITSTKAEKMKMTAVSIVEFKTVLLSIVKIYL